MTALRLGAHRPEPTPSTGVLDLARLAEQRRRDKHRQQDNSRNSQCDLSDHGHTTAYITRNGIAIALNASKATVRKIANSRIDELPHGALGLSSPSRGPGSPLRWSARAGKKVADIHSVGSLRSSRRSPPCGRSACNADRPLLSRYTGDTLREVELRHRGASSCVQTMRNGSRKHAGSNARSCRALHDCADLISDRSANTFGRRKPLSSLPLRSAVRFGLRPTKSRASASRPSNHSISCAGSFSNSFHRTPSTSLLSLGAITPVTQNK